jgi:hypothetical protein
VKKASHARLRQIRTEVNSLSQMLKLTMPRTDITTTITTIAVNPCTSVSLLLRRFCLMGWQMT